jgi:hypothetical protein
MAITLIVENETPLAAAGHPAVQPLELAPIPPNSAFKHEYVAMVRGYALLGATNRQIAKLLDVDLDTLTNWSKKFPAFDAAITEGRTGADLMVVNALYRRATGYTVKTRRTERVEAQQSDGSILVTNKETETEEEVPADVGAASRWLALRQGWSEKEGPVLTMDEVVRLARAAREEAQRRGIPLRQVLDEDS